VENNPEQPINQPSLIQQPLSPKSKFPIKFFIIFVLISTLIAFIAGGYFLRGKQNIFSVQNQQKTVISPPLSPTGSSAKAGDPTANWKAYRGAYPISFLYPENLKMSEGDADIFSTIRLWDPSGNDNDSEFSIYIYKSSKDQITQNLQKKGFSAQKEMDIDGLPSIQLNGTSTPNTRLPIRAVADVLVEVKNQVYVITNWHVGKNDSIFQKILNSVKFTDQNQTVDTSTWKTYVNTKVGFQIKYPARYPKPKLPSGAPDSPEIFADENTDDNDIIFGINSSDVVNFWVSPFFGTFEDFIASSDSLLESYTFVKNIKVGGVDAAWYNSSIRENITKVLFVGEGHGFMFDASPNYNQNEMEQMLSTFKFTNQKQTGKLLMDQIFYEVVSQLNLNINNLSYFRIFGLDKVQYGIDRTMVFAYKYAGKWQIAASGNGGPSSCSDLNNVPQNYRPPCIGESGRLDYADVNNRSLNYSPSRMTSYLKEP
jgi:hypothetical protein